MKITKPFTLLLVLCSLLSFGSAYGEDESYFVGEISSQDILSKFSNFAQHSNDVDYSESDLSTLKNLDADIQIKVFFGQWCHDSVREVPRIINLLQQVNNSNIKPWFYALDTSKSDPKMLAKEHGIKKTPTLIIYRDNIELGRILEVPESDWAIDISQLLNKN
jgi:thiol-disulfide isomerase/thioredoxin